ncbi:MAG TPA: DUF4214 domain-containing protein [Pseudolysinimonas sp.]|jgi:uncharacterized membrane protein
MTIGSYTFQTVSVAGATDGTWLGGINNAGEATGYDAGFGADHYPHAFTYANSVISPITVNDSSPNQATAAGINNGGQLVGTEGSSPVGVFGYLRSPDGSVQRISGITPSSQFGLFDQAYGINDMSQVVGADFAFSQHHEGFLWQNGTMSLFQVTGAAATEGHGINNAGVIVGTADSYGFIDFGGQMFLMAMPSATITDPMAVNNADTVAGSYFDGTHWHGWIDQAGSLTFIDAPGAADTRITGINDSNQLSGSFTPASGGPVQGFIATDPPDPSSIMVREDYIASLGRDADAGGLGFWVNQLNSGLAASAFVADLTGSAEFQALHGQQSDAQYVDSLYVNALGRPAEAGGQAGWVGVLQSGATRGDVMAAIAGSPEGQQHFAAGHG